MIKMFVEAQTTLYIDQICRLNNSYKYHSRKIIQHLIFFKYPKYFKQSKFKILFRIRDIHLSESPAASSNGKKK